jgi:phosphoribosyl 1,2-cyclic phosphate phosphodiesterase
MQRLKVLILDCLRLEKHGTHFHLDQALETVRALRPKKTILTHLGHDFDHAQWNRTLSREFGAGKVVLAFDGMKIRW